ncbi:hypothetical protein DpV83gp024 [Deerpox virus W-848-83]|uniref:Pyrin domain-containing protein n=1 Tax=Deerpox virus (strain Mule deer/United States/W-848-83/1983) TaxID=305674 RepID=Q08FX6_DPV83|nr:hypothetical protein DpV83gp024 [Deerpox virus W-848-83]ABI99181.1 hypothetical protein DpV83gp024 [Deerpox virus W-848-83]
MELRSAIIAVLENINRYQFKMVIFIVQDELYIEEEEKLTMDRIDLAEKLIKKYKDIRSLYFLLNIFKEMPDTEFVKKQLSDYIKRFNRKYLEQSDITFGKTQHTIKRKHRFRNMEVLKRLSCSEKRRLF